MTKKEIFDKIVETTAIVCDVAVEGMMSNSRKGDIVLARSMAVFWLVAAKLTTKDIMQFTGKTNHQSIDLIRTRVYDNWKEWDYHVLIEDIGRRLEDYGKSVGIEFDHWKPIRRIQEATGYRYFK